MPSVATHEPFTLDRAIDVCSDTKCLEVLFATTLWLSRMTALRKLLHIFAVISTFDKVSSFMLLFSSNTMWVSPASFSRLGIAGMEWWSSVIPGVGMGPASSLQWVERNGIVRNSNSPEGNRNGMEVPIPQRATVHEDFGLAPHF